MRIIVEAARGRRDLRHLQQFEGAMPRLALREPVVAHYGLDDLSADREDRIEGGHRLLEDHRYLCATQVAERAPIKPHHVLAGDGDRSRDVRNVSREQPHQGAQRDTLARARFADDAEHFAGVEREVDSVDRTDRTLATDKANREGLAAHERLRAGGSAGAKARSGLAHVARPHAAIRGAALWLDPGTSMWQAAWCSPTVASDSSKGSTAAQHGSAC